MIAGESLGYLLSEWGPMAILLVYLYLRDRKMEEAILKLAEETHGVDKDRVRDSLNVQIGGD